MRGTTGATLPRAGIALAAALLALSAGCAARGEFVYRPRLAEEGGRRLPVKVAVLPFAGAGRAAERPGNAMPPEAWARAFAEELAASGRFESARFVPAPSGLEDEGILVDGVVRKALLRIGWEHTQEFQVSFRATRRSDGKAVWGRELGRAWKTPTAAGGWCIGPKCVDAAFHEDWSRVAASLFAEARADLAATLATLPGGGAGGPGAGAAPPGPPGEEPLDRTIDRILKED